MKTSISILAAAQYQSCVRAIRTTLENIPNITEVYWCSDRPIPEDVGVPVKWIRIKPFIKGSPFDLWYNYISLRLLPAVVDSDFDVAIHADGFAVNKNAWTDEFYEYDYIGAVWPHMIPGENVGNGGFSWRSRKLYDALIDWQPSYEGKDWLGLSDPHYHVLADGTLTMPEDALIASPYRKYMEAKYGLKYAPEHIANQWSLEEPKHGSLIGKSLGFHGPYMASLLGVQLEDKEPK